MGKRTSEIRGFNVQSRPFFGSCFSKHGFFVACFTCFQCPDESSDGGAHCFSLAALCFLFVCNQRGSVPRGLTSLRRCSRQRVAFIFLRSFDSCTFYACCTNSVDYFCSVAQRQDDIRCNSMCAPHGDCMALVYALA